MQVKIRTATLEDVPVIVAMGAKFYATTHYARLARYCETSAQATATVLINTGFVLIAESEGQAVGMIGMIVAPFILNFSINNATEVMWWVDPGSRGSRAAVALVSASIAECKARNCLWQTMSLLASSPQNAARFYERIGFELAESSYLLEL